MMRVWLFAARAGIAASYLTLAITDPGTAGDLAGPYAGGVLAVAVVDLRNARKPPHA